MNNRKIDADNLTYDKLPYAHMSILLLFFSIIIFIGTLYAFYIGIASMNKHISPFTSHVKIIMVLICFMICSILFLLYQQWPILKQRKQALTIAKLTCIEPSEIPSIDNIFINVGHIWMDENNKPQGVLAIGDIILGKNTIVFIYRHRPPRQQSGLEHMAWLIGGGVIAGEISRRSQNKRYEEQNEADILVAEKERISELESTLLNRIQKSTKSFVIPISDIEETISISEGIIEIRHALDKHCFAMLPDISSVLEERIRKIIQWKKRNQTITASSLLESIKNWANIQNSALEEKARFAFAYLKEHPTIQQSLVAQIGISACRAIRSMNNPPYEAISLRRMALNIWTDTQTLTLIILSVTFPLVALLFGLFDWSMVSSAKNTSGLWIIEIIFCIVPFVLFAILFGKIIFMAIRTSIEMKENVLETNK